MSVYTYEKILTKAKECKSNVKKDYKLGISSKWSYYFAKSILAPKKNIKRIKFEKTENPTGDKINKTIKKSKYIKLAENYVNFIEKHHRMPNYVKYGDYKIRPRLITAFFAFIVAKDLPDEQKIKSSIFIKPKSKYGRSTKSGCDNRGQNTGYYCACHMAQEIVRNLTGKVIPQSTIAAVMGTTTSGTGHDGINTFFAWLNKKYAFNLKLEWKNFSDVGWNGIEKILESDNQDCGLHELYRDKWGHYTNFDKVYDNTVDVHNSLGSMCTSTCYCGYEENRTKSDARRYLSGISQKSVLIITKN